MALDHKAANRWVARFIPILLAGILGYVTWVITALVCADYLLNPSPYVRKPRTGAAVTILVLYFVFLLLLGSAYIRILVTIFTNPGFVPRGSQWLTQRETATQGKGSKRHKERRDSNSSEEKANGSRPTSERQNGDPVGFSYLNSALTAGRPNPSDGTAGLEEFYGRDVFICEGDGRPAWCSTCLNWKPDRAHHCREVGRCVRKMDHFCPWVGGIVSETNFKFFTQFVAWTAVFCVFVLIFMAVFVAELKQAGNHLNVHWILTLSFAALFGLFSIGMTGSSVQFALLNTTTVENLSRKVKVWTLAVYLPQPPDPAIARGFQSVTYATVPATASNELSISSTLSPPSRTFAILHSKQGENPFDLGPLENFKSVMGNYWYDWLLPLRYSPCCNHDRGDSAFTLGPVFEQMKQRAGLAVANHSRTPTDPRSLSRQNTAESESDRESRRRHRRRRRRRRRERRGKEMDRRDEESSLPEPNGVVG